MKKVISWVVAFSLLLCIFVVDAAPISYAAEQPLTNGELALLLMENLDLEYDSSMTIPYTDVPESSPYYEAICACYNIGIMAYDRTLFYIDDYTTRAHLAYLLCSTGLPTLYPAVRPSDVKSYDSVYGAICTVIALGIMSVDENGKFNPYNNLYASDVNFTAYNALFTPTTTSAANLDLANGSISVGVNDKGVTVFVQGKTIICTTANAGIIRQTNNATSTENTISVSDGAVALTISDLNIASTSASPISVANGASLTLNLLGENIMKAPDDYAGVHVPHGAELIVRGSGSMTATGGGGGAGIGGGSYDDGGTITINGGTVISTGGGGGAGIGGGSWGNGGETTISGGTVTATGGSSGAGIGGGNNGTGGTITITGGTVTATGEGNTFSGKGADGIGSGYGHNECTIIISGGTVTATGVAGSGIGGRTITISNGTVTATGIGYSEAGICSIEGTITISGGTVTAIGERTGIRCDYGSVKISNAEVTAEGYYWAIGGGDTSNEYGCESIDIEDSATVELTSNYGTGFSTCQEIITINKQPAESASHVGNRAKLSMDAYGYSCLSYQWQVSSDNSTWTDVEGQTSANASIPMSDANDGYYYRCKLTNRWGNVIYSESAQAYVLAFTKQPVSVDAALDDVVSFAVTPSCKNVTYQWERSYDDGQTWFAVDGETYQTLIVNATLSASSAKYRCVITATNGDTLASDIVEINLDTGNMVTYTAQYFLQKADGSGYVLKDQEVLDGISGETATAPVASYDGFSENTSKSKASGTIANDSSLILTRYFDRNTYSISFEMNGGSAIPAIEALYEAPVVAPDEPSRYGYTFAGWYADADFEEEYEFDTMPLNGATAYAKWELIGADRGVEYHINGLSLRSSENYETLDSIPNTAFFVEVSVTNLSADATDTIIIATYKENGQFIGMQYLYAKSQVGQTLTFGSYIDNTKGDIAKIKAFVLPTLGSPIPLANSAEVK